jgi:hypothetical protein
MTRWLVLAALVLQAPPLAAQSVSQRGFVEGRVYQFFQQAPNDSVLTVGDALFREEVFFRPAEWIQFAAGLDLRANSHSQVDYEWRLDYSDRGVLRPVAAVRRLAVTLKAGTFTVDVGKQFIRWGRADVLNPTDRFAPRDYVNVIDSDFLAVSAVRPSIQLGKETLEAVWVPYLTPSRTPLVDQRWTVPPPGLEGVPIVDGGSQFPSGSQEGVRWSHAGSSAEFALAFFNGFNNLPNINARVLAAPAAVELTRSYPDIRTYGGDLAIPTRWLTLKSEAAYTTSPSSTSEEYVLYVVEIERQTGEWVLDVGYAGEVLTKSGPSLQFAPDRGIARSILARASYTVDPRRTIAIEGVVRQDGSGFYIKGEYSLAVGQHWRFTADGVGLGGSPDDFLGQYQRNSYTSLALRYSF